MQHVLAHDLSAGSRLWVFVFEVHTHQLQDGAVQIAEEEPHRHHHGQRQDAQLQVLQVNKVVFESSPAEVAEVEDVGCPIDADHH